MSVSSVTSRPPFSLEDLRELRKLNKDLGAVEAIPVSSSDNLSGVKVKEKSYQEWISSAQKVLNFFKQHKAVSSKEKKELSRLEQQLSKEEYGKLSEKEKKALTYEIPEIYLEDDLALFGGAIGCPQASLSLGRKAES